jgi:hypothetical protein
MRHVLIASLLASLYLSFALAGPTAVPSDAEVAAAIASSDDFATYKDAFLLATSTLVAQGTCSLAELKYMGGWVKSQNHKKEPIYFTYCGGLHISKRIYLDVVTGEIFR